MSAPRPGPVACLLALSLALSLALAGAPGARGEEPPAAGDPGARLREMLTNGTPDGNTIPLEQEILRLRAEKAADALVEFLEHERWGSVVLWALADVAGPDEEGALLAAFAKMPLPSRVESALWLAKRPSAPVKEALAMLFAEQGLEGDARDQVRAARLRAGDEGTAKEVRAALAGKDALAIAQALLLAGDARATAFLPQASALAKDPRPVDPPRKSRFEVRTRTEIPGGYSETTTYPDLTTLGAVALEAASRMVLPDTPEMIAWWYEVEETPRFGTGEEGAKRLAAYVAADAKAKKAGAPTADAAIRLALAHLRTTRGEEMGKARVTEVSFDRAWTITGTVDGEPWKAAVSAKGEVSVP